MTEIPGGFAEKRADWSGLPRIVLEIRPHMSGGRQAFILSTAIVLGLAISCLILMAAGVSAGTLLREFFIETIFDRASQLAIARQAAPLILVGLGAAAAFRVRIWNLGLEGQMIWGGIGATFVSIYQIGPLSTRLLCMAVMAMVAGMFWAAVVTILKFRFRVNEIISSLLLNYVAIYVLLDLIYGAWKDPKENFPHSPQFLAAERLPDIFPDINAGLIIALIAVVAMHWFGQVSRFGFYTRTIESNPEMAKVQGVSVTAITVAALLVSGALCGLSGFVVVSASEGRLTPTFFEGFGFSGVLIAFLARNNPIMACLTACLVSMLFVSGQSLQVFYQIPFSMVQLIQAFIVMCVAGSEFFIRHRIRWVK